jgi:hypothetical protein
VADAEIQRQINDQVTPDHWSAIVAQLQTDSREIPQGKERSTPVEVNVVSGKSIDPWWVPWSHAYELGIVGGSIRLADGTGLVTRAYSWGQSSLFWLEGRGSYIEAVPGSKEQRAGFQFW